VTTEVVACINDCGDDTDPVTKICFGVAHDSLQHWVPPAYTALIKRDHFLTKDEIVRLGAGKTAIMGRIREETKERRNTFGEPNRGSFSAFLLPVGLGVPMEVPPDFYSG
jgi:hypothetical protein